MAEKQRWDVRVQKIVDAVNLRATRLMVLGYSVYGSGTAVLLIFVPDKALATLLVMFFFQLLVLYFGTREMYPCIAGGFKTALEANRDSVPLFEKVAEAVEGFEKNPENHPAVKAIGDRLEKIFAEKISPVVSRWERIGEQVEKVTLPRLEEAIHKVDAKVSSTMEGIKRTQQMVEGELATGLLQELRQASVAVKLLAAPHVPSMDPSSMLNSLANRKPRNGAPPAIPVAPPGGRS